jgi:hypothetical protein
MSHFFDQEHICNLMTSSLLWFYSPLLTLRRFFSFLILYTVGMTPWTSGQPSEGLYLHTEQHKHRIKARTQTSMS